MHFFLMNMILNRATLHEFETKKWKDDTTITEKLLFSFKFGVDNKS